jgi:homotetrameric cytidine deaminase
MASNVELKARDGDPAATLERALALGAEDRGVLRQRDTYFRVPHGRLKLREQDGAPAELVQYVRADEAAARESRFERVPAADGVRDALAASLGVRVVVDKARHLLVVDDVRIHLDEVEGLGRFVELEALVTSTTGDAAARCERVRAALGIEEVEPRGYADLLQAAPAELLEAARVAMERAHVPYSHFKVGAALRAPSGAVYAAPNVENASYPQGQCAETSAIGALFAAGEREIVGVAVVAEQTDFCPPCGGCRQRLAEFAGPDVPVHLGARTLALGELLPHRFAL